MKIKEICFNFVGVYDTVASHGLYHGNDVSDLKLNSVSKARYVFHLASDDEYRENFDLSNIDSAGLKGFELTLPGVHSDIGGSYLNNTEEISVIDNLETADTPQHRENAERQKGKKYDSFKKIVVDEGWFGNEQLKKQFFYEKDLDPFTSFIANQFNYGLVGRRKLANTYDKIPLDLMISKSKTFDVVYKDSTLKKNAINDDFINDVYNQLKGYINDCVSVRNAFVTTYNDSKTNYESLSKEYLSKMKTLHYRNYIAIEDLKKLRKNYLHWSVKSNLFGLEARKEGALAEKERKREIHNG
ncbi:phospholipase effector Tle1 domain-containing protein [Flavobacterium sp.]|uniref:phospholipase effector Tle1 domain-containing protein n=1 Tax=Flavobacterium sp. TaxID=239 RepID=UPI004047C791